MKQTFLIFSYILLTFAFQNTAESQEKEKELIAQSTASSAGTSTTPPQAGNQNLVRYVSSSKENSRSADQTSIPLKVNKTFELPLKSKSFSKTTSIIALTLMLLGVLGAVLFIRRRSRSTSGS